MVDRATKKSDTWLGGSAESGLPIDESGFSKNGTRSVGATRHRRGRLDKCPDKAKRIAQRDAYPCLVAQISSSSPDTTHPDATSTRRKRFGRWKGVRQKPRRDRGRICCPGPCDAGYPLEQSEKGELSLSSAYQDRQPLWSRFIAG
jgi:hypothetical protein